MDDRWKSKLRLGEQMLAQNDPIMRQLIAAHGPCTITPHTDYYHQLVKAIIGQQLSVKAAATIFGRFMALFGDVIPTPQQILAIDSETLRSIGCSYPKANYMKDLAQHIIDGRLDLDHIATLSNEVVVQQLTAVKGIGEWSAHMFMMFCLGRLDVLPVGDLGVKKAMMLLYGYDHLPLPKEMTETANIHKWTPHESIAAWYLWRSLDNEPK